MKKLVLFILVLSCIAILVACGGGSTNNDAVPPSGNNSSDNAQSPSNDDASDNGQTQTATVNDLIIGTWSGDENGESITYTFKKDGTFSANYCSGTYTISGDKITLVADMGDTDLTLFDNEPVSVSGNTLNIAHYSYTKQ